MEAARIITGVARGARSLALTVDAGLPALDTVCMGKAAAQFIKCLQLPAQNPLSSIVRAPATPRRLKARGGGLRPSWGDSARALVAPVNAGHIEERVPMTMLPRPWRGTHVEFLCTPNTRREDPDWLRRQEALIVLDGLHQKEPPCLQIWSDGAAEEGIRNGGGGS